MTQILLEEDAESSLTNAVADDLFVRLDTCIEAMWRQAQDGAMWQHVIRAGMPADLYRDLMVQVYHYTRYNSLNQALTVIGVSPQERPLLRFIYRHADG